MNQKSLHLAHVGSNQLFQTETVFVSHYVVFPYQACPHIMIHLKDVFEVVFLKSSALLGLETVLVATVTASVVYHYGSTNTP